MSPTDRITADFLREMPLPDPGEGDKRMRGNVLVIAGSEQVPGAALLAGTAALRAGAGRLQIATSSKIAVAIGVAVPEALVLGLVEKPRGAIDSNSLSRLEPHLAQADAVLIGPGLDHQQAIEALTRAVLNSVAPNVPIVFDAKAIKTLGGLGRHVREGIIITPHAGEMAALRSLDRAYIEANAEPVAERAARDLGITVALKGAKTFVASPGQQLAVCEEGNVGLATSGSGDVLAGVVAGLLARGAPPFTAVCWGVYAHAKAGDQLAQAVGPLGFLARDLLLDLAGIFGKLSAGTK